MLLLLLWLWLLLWLLLLLLFECQCQCPIVEIPHIVYLRYSQTNLCASQYSSCTHGWSTFTLRSKPVVETPQTNCLTMLLSKPIFVPRKIYNVKPNKGIWVQELRWWRTAQLCPCDKCDRGWWTSQRCGIPCNWCYNRRRTAEHCPRHWIRGGCGIFVFVRSKFVHIFR